MTYIEAQPSACFTQNCSDRVVRRIAAEPWNGIARGGAAAGRGEGSPKGPSHSDWFGAQIAHKKRVWTLSTPSASDSVVPVSDWAGLGMFSKEGRICRGSGWFESHLGHVFSLFRGFLASDCGHLFTCRPLRGPFSLVAGAVAGCLLAFLDGRVVVRYQFMGVHGSADMTCEIFGVSFFGASLGVHQVPPYGCWWLICLSMVGAGEGGMTCPRIDCGYGSAAAFLQGEISFGVVGLRSDLLLGHDSFGTGQHDLLDERPH
ncbi:hypothetical protein ABIE00_002686 [Arthrobacter sp. OAP107]